MLNGYFYFGPLSCNRRDQSSNFSLMLRLPHPENTASANHFRIQPFRMSDNHVSEE
jgi:hypothetical protein